MSALIGAKRCKWAVCSIMSVIPGMAAHEPGSGDDDFLLIAA
jgi:hypothetical protein